MGLYLWDSESQPSKRISSSYGWKVSGISPLLRYVLLLLDVHLKQQHRRRTSAVSFLPASGVVTVSHTNSAHAQIKLNPVWGCCLVSVMFLLSSQSFTHVEEFSLLGLHWSLTDNGGWWEDAGWSCWCHLCAMGGH